LADIAVVAGGRSGICRAAYIDLPRPAECSRALLHGSKFNFLNYESSLPIPVALIVLFSRRAFQGGAKKNIAAQPAQEDARLMLSSPDSEPSPTPTSNRATATSLCLRPRPR